jgi:hypothetical protein
MTYSRVLGTICLIGATVLGAMGPAQVSQAAPASPKAHRQVHGVTRLSPAAAKAAALQALRTGYFKTRSGHRVYLSSALVNNIRGVGGAKASGHADISAPPSIGNGQRANQDFGFYLTGNGQLFHNTESVAVDPVSPIHVVISATDTRLGSDGSIFNLSSDPILDQGFNPTCFAPSTTVGGTGLTPTPCSLIQALGGPGVYNSTQGVTAPNSFSDLIVPDMLSGAVPDAINTAACPTTLSAAQLAAIPTAGLSTAYGVFTTAAGYPSGCTPPTITAPATTFPTQVQATVACIPASGAFLSPAVLLNTPGMSNACVPYDSVGDQSVAFDTTGALYVVSLGLVSIDPLARGTGPFTDAPQTDVVLNVSPAIQPVGSTNGTVSQTNQPNAAGRVFNNTAPTTTCNPTQPSTVTCMHNEVIASSASSNFLSPTDYTSSPSLLPSPASVVGRNWQADDGLIDGPGLCDSTVNAPFFDFTSGDFCLIDSPYLVINGVVDPTAYVTYSVYDFSLTTSNIYLTTALVPGPGAGGLPIWQPPTSVDNPGFFLGAVGNPFCAPDAFFGSGTTFCTDSWGAEPTVGPDGTVYIAYENGDVPGGDVANCITPFGVYCNQILVATAFQPSFTAATLTFYVAKSQDNGQTFGVNPATTSMPLPTTPLGADYCGMFGFTSTNFPGTSTSGFGTAALAACNAVPYFGTYTGIAWDKNNGAFVSWTDTRPNNKNFMVPGSQDVYSAHVS